MTAPLRFCPQCDADTEAALCPNDGTTTLLVLTEDADLSRLTEGYSLAGRYKLEHQLGRGGYGAVFAARHAGTGQQVAIKVLSAGGDKQTLKRFFREARVTASLRSRQTIRVTDFGQDHDGLTYLAMELLHGRTVSDVIAQRMRSGQALSEKEAIEVGLATCKSLQEAHRSHLVHRDLKPQNLFWAETEDGPVIKVLDFGIVKVRNQSLTGDSIIGTTSYMSPEQAMSQPIDGRSDLYSLGCVLFELVTGRLPFEGESPVQTLVMHIRKPAPHLDELATVPLSQGYKAVVAKALAKAPGDRFQSAEELATALTALAAHASEVSHIVDTQTLSSSAVAAQARTALAAQDERGTTASWVDAATAAIESGELESLSPTRAMSPAEQAAALSDSEQRGKAVRIGPVGGEANGAATVAIAATNVRAAERESAAESATTGTSAAAARSGGVWIGVAAAAVLIAAVGAWMATRSDNPAATTEALAKASIATPAATALPPAPAPETAVAPKPVVVAAPPAAPVVAESPGAETAPAAAEVAAPDAGVAASAADDVAPAPAPAVAVAAEPAPQVRKPTVTRAPRPASKRALDREL